MLKCSLLRAETEPREEKKPEIDDKFWDLLLSADKKDYESICAQYGITDFRWMLKKLNEKKIEREQEQQKVSLSFILIYSKDPTHLNSKKEMLNSNSCRWLKDFAT